MQSKYKISKLKSILLLYSSLVLSKVPPTIGLYLFSPFEYNSAIQNYETKSPFFTFSFLANVFFSLF
jgi:hypothetical protein